MAEWKNRLMSRFGGKKAKEEDEKKPGKNVSFQKTATVYSDSIIVDAIPAQQTCDENDNYVKEHEKIVQTETQEKHLTRDQVVYMLKNRFKSDLDDWQSRTNQIPVDMDVCSEPSRSPKLSTRKRYGQVPQSPDNNHPTLPRKMDNKSGTIWLQCGEEIKQVQLPREAVTLGHVRQMFRDNFQSELKQYTFGADRGILLIRDPFTRTFKELHDMRHVLPRSHLKLLAPKKKPCRSPEHAQMSKSFSFDDRRRSRSFTSETSNALSSSTLSVPAGISRARAGSYSFNGSTKTGYIVTPKRHVVTRQTSTPKFNHSTVRPAEAFPKEISKSPHINTPGSGENSAFPSFGPSSPSYGKPQTHNRTGMSPSRYQEVSSPSQKVMLTGIGSRLNSSEVKRPPRSPVEEELDSLTDLLQEALRTESVSDVKSHDNSTDSLHAPPRSTYSPSEKEKMRSASDSGTESLISETFGCTTFESKKKPPPPRRLSSKEATKSLSPQNQHESLENTSQNSVVESPRRSIVRPRVWVDTSNRARDNSIKVTSAYLKKDVKQLRIQLEELRNQHEYNSHVFHSMISKTGKRITHAIEAVIPAVQVHKGVQKQKLREEENAYQRRSDNAEKTMRRLESEIEMLREAAVNYKSNAKQGELNDIHSSMENLSKSISSLKSDFETLNREARVVMAEEKHFIFEKERFFKEEPLRLDQLVNRCRHAVGTLLRLKKLTSAAQQDASTLSRIGNTSHTVKSQMKETDTIKRSGSYRRGNAVVTQISHKTKVEYGGTTTTTDYNQNTTTQGNVDKTAKVRFNDPADSKSYRQ